MQIEVEQKFPVCDAAALERQLTALGATRQNTLVQIDRYFAHPARDFARTDEALRLRHAGGLNYITYKGPKLDATTKTRREIEIELRSGEQAGTDAGDLLLALGFTPVAEVRKRRQHSTVPWQGRQVGIALDDVEGLGHYVELEIMASQADVADERARLAALADRLGLSNSERRSYLELLLERASAAGTAP